MIPALNDGSAFSAVLGADSAPPVDSMPHSSPRRAPKSANQAIPLTVAETLATKPAAEAEREFMEAIRSYKQSSGRMFPTWSEVLEVIRTLGYEKSV